MMKKGSFFDEKPKHPELEIIMPEDIWGDDECLPDTPQKTVFTTAVTAVHQPPPKTMNLTINRPVYRIATNGLVK